MSTVQYNYVEFIEQDIELNSCSYCVRRVYVHLRRNPGEGSNTVEIYFDIINGMKREEETL